MEIRNGPLVAHSLAHSVVHRPIHHTELYRQFSPTTLLASPSKLQDGYMNKKYIELTKDGIGWGGAAFNWIFLGLDWDLYHVSLYQFQGSPFVTFPTAGSLDLGSRGRGLLPWGIEKLSSLIENLQVSIAWHSSVNWGLTHRTGTLTRPFSRPEYPSSVSSPHQQTEKSSWRV